MSRPNPVVLSAVLIGLAVAYGALALAKGGFFVTKHEGDTIHLLQIVFRMVAGEWPHLDFVTPIGVLAFAPIALFVEFGVGIGMAILMSQVLVAALALPALIWAGYSRFEGALAYAFGAFVLILTLALVYGEADRAVSISMHYNRWAWAVSFVVIVLALMPPREVRADTADGIFIGLGMAALALCKVTYFAAFAGPVVLALVLRGAFRSLWVAVLAGLAVVAVVTMGAGFGFWGAYLGDLLTVSGSDIRPAPGDELRAIAGAPEYLGGTLTLFAGVILLRQAGAQLPGLILLLLAPGFIYVTYQNFGNDPQWLPLLGVLLLAYRPKTELRNGFGWNLRSALNIAAMAAFAFAAPSVFNLAYSPFRHLNVNTEDYVPMLSRIEGHGDLQMRVVRANRVDGTVGLDAPGSGLEDRAELADREATRTELNGELLPDCELTQGLTAWLETMVADLETAGLAGDIRVFPADLISGYWLFGDLRSLPGGAPWYYDGLPGIDAADYVIVPLCPLARDVRKSILEEIEDAGIVLREARRAPLYRLFEIVRDQ